MLQALNILNSTLASTVRLWRGTDGRPAAHQPAELLRLYDIESCPYCRLVREALTELDLDAMILPCPRDGQRFRADVVAAGGKAQFPYLEDPNTGAALYESADIVAYLFEEYGRRPAPPALLRLVSLPGSIAGSALRAVSASRARPTGRPPAEPLELYSFESSPFARPVRELLCALEIPYRLRNTGKAMWQDYGPPQLRAALFPDLPVAGRNRLELLERAGRVQVPFLIDPNTGVERFESQEICNYLRETYTAD